jgi:DNA invertase Pin-like site-specific DNA recombinase
MNLFGYAIASADGRGPSIEEQALLVHDAAVAKFPEGTWRDCLCEKLTFREASRDPLMSRPAGQELCRQLQPGDRVLIARLEAIIMTAENFKKTLSWFKLRSVHLHCLDLEEVLRGSLNPLDVAYYVLGLARMTRTRVAQRIQKEIRDQVTESGLFKERAVPFGCQAVKAVPPVFDKRGRPQLMLVPHPAQRALLENILNWYEVRKKTFEAIGLKMESDWDDPLTIQSQKFADRAVVFFYELGRYYRNFKGVSCRYLNLSIIPRYQKVRLKHWKPPADLELSDEQKAEIERWQYPMGWRARPIATEEERAKHLAHKATPGEQQKESSAAAD